MDVEVLQILNKAGNGNLHQVVFGPGILGYNSTTKVYDNTAVSPPSGEILGPDDIDILDIIPGGPTILTRIRSVSGVITVYPQVKI